MRGVLVAVLLLTVMMFSGCTGDVGSDFAPIASADWKPGYQFTTAVEMQGSFVGKMYVDGNLMMDEAESIGPETAPGTSLTVLSTTMRDGDVPMYLVRAQPGPDDGGYLMGIRQEDLLVRMVDLNQLAGCLPSCTSLSFLSPTQPEHALIKFPLARGMTWTTEIPVEDAPMGIGDTWAITSRVQGMQTIASKFGPVEAVRIEHTIEIPDLEELERRIEQEGRAAGVKNAQVNFEFSGSLASHFAPSLHAIVQTELQVTFSIQMSGTDPDGSRMSGDIHGDMRVTEKLTEALLVETPELSLAEILGVDVTPDPVIVPPPPEIPSAIGIAVRADKSDLNAADSPNVMFRIESKLAPAAGDRIFLRLVNALGETIAAKEGTSLDYTFEEMGAYSAVAEHMSNGELVGRDVLPIPVRYEADHELLCGVVVWDVRSCEPLPIPVRVGIASLEIEAVHRLVPLPLARLVLSDTTGETVAGTTFDGASATIAMTAFTETMFGTDWNLQYDTVAGVNEALDVHVTLLPYTGAPKTITEQAMNLLHRMPTPHLWLD